MTRNMLWHKVFALAAGKRHRKANAWTARPHPATFTEGNEIANTITFAIRVPRDVWAELTCPYSEARPDSQGSSSLEPFPIRGRSHGLAG
jgi:hypothetical protein